LIAAHLAEGEGLERVAIGIETDRGPWVTALVASGYQVYAVNPLSVSRYPPPPEPRSPSPRPAAAHDAAAQPKSRPAARPPAGSP